MMDSKELAEMLTIDDLLSFLANKPHTVFMPANDLACPVAQLIGAKTARDCSVALEFSDDCRLITDNVQFADTGEHVNLREELKGFVCWFDKTFENANYDATNGYAIVNKWKETHR